MIRSCTRIKTFSFLGVNEKFHWVMFVLRFLMRWKFFLLFSKFSIFLVFHSFYLKPQWSVHCPMGFIQLSVISWWRHHTITWPVCIPQNQYYLSKIQVFPAPCSDMEGAVAQSVERVASGGEVLGSSEEVLGSITVVAARSLLVGSVSV